MRCRCGSSCGAGVGVFVAAGAGASFEPAAPGAGAPSSRCGRCLLAGPQGQVRAAVAVVADFEVQRVARAAAAERRQQEKGDAQDQVHAERRRIMRASPAQEFDGEHAGPEGERLQRAPDARVEIGEVAQQVPHQRAERQHADFGALSAVRAVLAAQHFAAIEAVLGRERAADEFLAVCQYPSLGRVAVAELFDALAAHARRVLAQVRLQRGPVTQPVLDDATDPVGRRHRLVVEDLGRQEPLELEHVRDVVAQPGVERRFDGRIGLEVDLVEDGFVVVVGRHGRKGSASGTITGRVHGYCSRPALPCLHTVLGGCPGHENGAACCGSWSWQGDDPGRR